MEATIAAILASSSLTAVITWALSRKKNQASVDNLIANTANTLVQASNVAISDLVTRLTKVEEKLKLSLEAQKQCEQREKKLNARITALEGREKNLLEEIILLRQDNEDTNKKFDGKN